MVGFWGEEREGKTRKERLKGCELNDQLLKNLDHWMSQNSNQGP